jgi:hypothetical protein
MFGFTLRVKMDGNGLVMNIPINRVSPLSRYIEDGGFMVYLRGGDSWFSPMHIVNSDYIIEEFIREYHENTHK